MSFFYRFLKKIRLVVNPTLIESEIWTGSYRHPSPASQIPVKTKQKLPKLTNKYYFERDHRRNYPQTVTYTNSFNLPAPESPQTKYVVSVFTFLFKKNRN
ncbi:hypothetical protein HMI55_006348 [Coelomomyces lativittatus]|nr:hypothetical protein HMI55_006348 [Coelomomyces lativittatus]